MAFPQRQDSRDDHLNDSWVELHFQGQMHQLSVEPPSLSKPLSHGTMEKLLLDAQREWSRTSSRMGSNVGSATSSRGSPCPRSPTTELSSMGIGEISTIQEGRVLLPQDVGTDWLWDWSRPETSPLSSGDVSVSKGKLTKRSALSIRNTKVMRNGVFCLENLPMMLLTHACTFFFGAAVMFIYLKKYCGWSSVTRITTIVD